MKPVNNWLPEIRTSQEGQRSTRVGVAVPEPPPPGDKRQQPRPGSESGKVGPAEGRPAPRRPREGTVGLHCVRIAQRDKDKRSLFFPSPVFVKLVKNEAAQITS